MASSNRADIITEAIYRASRKNQNLNLVSSFDAILIEMTTVYPIIGHQNNSGNMTANNRTIALPTNYRYWEGMKVGSSLIEIDWEDPGDFIKHNLSENATEPYKWTVIRKDGKIYAWPTPTTACPYEFWYSKISEKSTGDNYVHNLGEEYDETIIKGVTYKACELIQEYQRALWWRSLYEDELSEKCSIFLKSMKRVPYNDF